MQCNLKPANMRGVKSFAMVLCVRVSLTAFDTHSQRSTQATSKEGKDGGIELVKPPENSNIGDAVYFEGPDYESESFSLRYHTPVFTTVFCSRHNAFVSAEPEEKDFRDHSARFYHFGYTRGCVDKPRYKICT
jgi:hypothetical protein